MTAWLNAASASAASSVTMTRCSGRLPFSTSAAGVAGDRPASVKDKVDGPLLDRSLRYAIERKRAEQALARLATIMGAICYDCGRKLSADDPMKGFES
jgi:hypothetical protein